MGFVKATEALTKKGELKKGYISKTNKLGRINYMNDPTVKKKVIKENKPVTKTQPKTQQKTSKINIKGVKKSLTEGIDN
jgi:hypothetical protein